MRGLTIPAVTLLLLVLTVPDARADYRVIGGGPYLGMEYFSPLGESRHHDFLYPVTGLFVDAPSFFANINSIFPFLLIDGIAAGIQFLSSGDSGFPLWSSLNGGDDNPGRFRMMNLDLRLTIQRQPGMKVDAGLSYDVAWMNPLFKPALSPEEVAEIPGAQHRERGLGNLLHNVAATFGVGMRNEFVATNIALAAGNGMGNMSLWNPFVGLEAFTRVRLGNYVGLYLRLDAQLQRLDYSGFEFNNAIDDKVYDLDFAEWHTTLTVDAGLVVTFSRNEEW